jgi:hypothetical protein
MHINLAIMQILSEAPIQTIHYSQNPSFQVVHHTSVSHEVLLWKDEKWWHSITNRIGDHT